jgi:hypothetical protein
MTAVRPDWVMHPIRAAELCHTGCRAVQPHGLQSCAATVVVCWGVSQRA